MALKVKPIFEEIARRNSQANLQHSSTVRNLTVDRADKKVGEIAGMSHDTVSKVEAILEQGDNDLINKVRSGETSINYAYKSIVRANEHRDVPELPKDSFDIILADPPWSYDINTRGSPDRGILLFALRKFTPYYIIIFLF